MSGHSKWSQIKRQKGVADQKRGAMFTRLGRDIVIAVREGGSGDLNANARLRLAVQKAREANMPADNIDRAIKRGLGGGEGQQLEEIVYEGYGPQGVALMVEVLTDNRNRAAAEVRSIFNKHNGSLGASGSVAWQFEPRGVIEAEPGKQDPDEIALAALDAGAEDADTDGEVIEIYTTPDQLDNVRQALEDQGVKVTSAQRQLHPTNTVSLDNSSSDSVMRMIERLEELDDVQSVYSNAEFAEEAMERYAAAS